MKVICLRNSIFALWQTTDVCACCLLALFAHGIGTLCVNTDIVLPLMFRCQLHALCAGLLFADCRRSERLQEAKPQLAWTQVNQEAHWLNVVPSTELPVFRCKFTGAQVCTVGH